MAIDRRLQIYDEQGNLVDYDILASDVKFLPDGKDLPTKLAEMQDDIEDAGSGDGTVTGVKIGSTTYEPTDGVVDLSSPMGDKVDKNGTDSLMTAAEHTKLAGIAAGAQVNVINSISVNGTTQTPQNGNVNISVEGAAGEDGITPHIGQNGNWWIGPETDQNNDTGIKAQGPAGSVTITDGDIDTLEVHNALNAYTGLLGMSGAMRIKSNIDSLYASLNRLYGKLANMAFLDSEDQEDAAPTPIDWSLPKKTLTVTNGIVNGIVKYNGDVVTEAITVDIGSSVELLVVGAGNYVITSVSASGATITDNEDGTFTVVVIVDDNMTLAISGSAERIKTKIWYGKSLDQNGVPVTDTDSCYTDFVALDGLTDTDVAVWTYNLNKVSSSNQYKLKRNLAFYDCNKRLMFYESEYDAIWHPLSYTQNNNNSRTLTVANLETVLNAAGVNVPAYARFSFGISNGAIKSGCGFTQGSTQYFDISNIETATSDEVVHDITFSLTGCATTATDNQSKVLSGQPLELLFKADGGGNIANFAVGVTVGGVTVQPTVSDFSRDGISYKKVVIENITDDVVITASM